MFKMGSGELVQASSSILLVLGTWEGKVLVVTYKPLGYIWTVTFPKSRAILTCWHESVQPCTSQASNIPLAEIY